jgi:hypothetical protein
VMVMPSSRHSASYQPRAWLTSNVGTDPSVLQTPRARHSHLRVCANCDFHSAIGAPGEADRRDEPVGAHAPVLVRVDERERSRISAGLPRVRSETIMGP